MKGLIGQYGVALVPVVRAACTSGKTSSIKVHSPLGRTLMPTTVCNSKSVSEGSRVCSGVSLQLNILQQRPRNAELLQACIRREEDNIPVRKLQQASPHTTEVYSRLLKEGKQHYGKHCLCTQTLDFYISCMDIWDVQLNVSLHFLSSVDGWGALAGWVRPRKAERPTPLRCRSSCRLTSYTKSSSYMKEFSLEDNSR